MKRIQCKLEDLTHNYCFHAVTCWLVVFHFRSLWQMVANWELQDKIGLQMGRFLTHWGNINILQNYRTTHPLVRSRHVPSNIFHIFDCAVDQIKTGAFHFVVLLKDSRIFVAGSNSNQQLGGTFIRKGIMELTSDWIAKSPPIDICCSSDHTFILTNDHHVLKVGNSQRKLHENIEKYTDVMDVEVGEFTMALTMRNHMHLRWVFKSS